MTDFLLWFAINSRVSGAVFGGGMMMIYQF
jgi:hypothetical protein